MRLATFNIENMFERPAAMNLPEWSDGRQVLQDFSQLNNLISKTVYTSAAKKKLLKIMERNKGLLTRGRSKYIRRSNTDGNQRLMSRKILVLIFEIGGNREIG